MRRGQRPVPHYFLRPELVRAGTFWPLRRASDKPIAIACFVERAPCLPSRICSISSRTNSPAAVVGDFLIWTFPNAGNPQKVERYVADWADALDEMAELGAETTHATVDGPLSDAARRFSGREGVDLVVETAGTPEAVTHALELVRPGGRVVLIGLPHEPTPVSFFSVVRREVTITGSMIYQDEFPEALRLVEEGAVRTGPLITHRFSLDRIGEAFTAHTDPASIKVALEI